MGILYYGIVVFFLVLKLGDVAGEYMQGNVYMKGSDEAQFVPGVFLNNATAQGFFNQTLNKTGWGMLEIRSGFGNGLGNNADIMFAAGYMEGIFTAEQMWMHYQNSRAFFLSNRPKKVEDDVKNFFIAQEQWAKQNVAKHGGNDPFWRHVGYVLKHIDGLYAGYSKMAKDGWDKSKFVVQFLNSVGDLIDLVNALDPSSIPKFDKMSNKEFDQYVHSRGHCSALVKITPAFENMFMSHSSWFVYGATNRIYKHYYFNLNDPATAAKSMAFSSYPGFLESLDDFYLMSSQLVMLQTTNNIFDKSLYKLVRPESLLAWQRVRIANLMAHSGQEWYSTVSQYNSGTYNNQYMVIDLKQVHLGERIDDGALWVVEQTPGLVVGNDQTQILRAGYWPSYNVPFYEAIYNRSGYPAMVKLRGTDYSYQLAPRAKIFRRDQGGVKDITSMKAIMRYNDYKNDPYSEGNACNSICCRGDLNIDNPVADGCYDTKVSDFRMAQKRQAFIINGPTRSHNLPPFSWSARFADTPHLGLPETYNFDWVYSGPTLQE